MRWLKKILRVAGILVLSLLLLLLLAAGIVYIPAVQKKLSTEAMQWLSAKTGGHFTTEAIYLRWPLSLSIHRLLILEPEGDTLLYAGYFQSGISLPRLIKGGIAIADTRLENAVVSIHRGRSDSTFNFNFIIEAFSDSAKKDTASKSPAISLNEVRLSKVNFRMSDQVSGSDITVNSGSLLLNFSDIDLNELRFSLDEVALENTRAFIWVPGQEVVADTLYRGDTVDVQLPVVVIQDFLVGNTDLMYVVSNDTAAISGHVGRFVFSDGVIDMEASAYTFGKIRLEHSNLAMLSKPPQQEHTMPQPDDTSSGIFFKAEQITLVNNYFQRSAGGEAIAPFAFNPSQLDLQKVNAEIEDVYYDRSNITATINELSFRDGDKFIVNALTVNAALTPHSASLKNFTFSSPFTLVRGNVALSFRNLEAISGDPGATGLNVELDIPRAGIKDILYWVPALAGNPALKKATQQASLAVTAKGSVNDLHISQLLFNYGVSTRLALNGFIRGLPDPKSLSYNFPSLTFYSTARELPEVLPAGTWPQNILLPHFINLSASAKGDRNTAEGEVLLETDAGSIATTAALTFAGDTSYVLDVTTDDLHINRILGDSAGLGQTAFVLNLKGHGFNPERLWAGANLQLAKLAYRGYTYRDLKLYSVYDARNVKVDAVMNDSALAFDLKGNGNISKDNEFIKLNFDLKGADLRQMNMTEEDLRISALFTADLKGTNADNLNGTAGITRFIIAKNKNTYVLDSLVFASINEEGRNSMKFTSSVLMLDFDGNVKPTDLAAAFRHQLNHYYPFFDSLPHTAPQHFRMDIQLTNHPVLNEVFLKDLTDFLPAKISAEFNSEEHLLKSTVDIPRIHYGGNKLENLRFMMDGNDQRLVYALRMEEISAGTYGLDNFLARGQFGNNSGNIRVREGIKEEDEEKKDTPRSKKLDGEFVITALPDKVHQVYFLSPLMLGNKEWTIPEDNYIRTAGNNTKVYFNNLRLDSQGESISLANKGDDLRVDFGNFNLTNISGMISRDTFPVAGALDGFVLVRRTGEETAIESELELRDFQVMAVPVGSLSMKARQKSSDLFGFNVLLSGNGNDMRIDGDIRSQDTTTTLDINGNIKTLNAAIFDGLSFGALKQTAGKISGDFQLRGNAKAPELNANLALHEFSTVPDATGVRIFIDDETITLTPTALNIPAFEITDERQGMLEINGTVAMENITPGELNINVRARDFTVFNTARTQDAPYYGNLKIDGTIQAGGRMQQPELSATLRIDEGSDFAVVVPQEELSADRGEEVITFRDSTQLHPILTRGKTEVKDKNSITGFSIDSRLTIDEKARFRLLIDPSTGDSLAVSGAANIAFAMTPSGDVTLTGLYSLKDGSYFTSLQDVLQKRFLIQEGSTIRWNGDPLDAELDIDAIYKVKTSPADLITGQISGLSDAEQNQYKQRLEFHVFLELNGQLLKPDISFRIEIAEADRGAMGGIVDTRLRQVNEDESELNKQVFALLLLNRFVQEDPLATASGSSGAEGVARSSVSRFLSDQLNQMAGRYIAGAELTFNVESYEDYSQGDPQGRTEVGVALKKQFLDERFSVQVGGGFDVEGEAARTNQLSDITGDVLVEYKLTDDGRFRASGFRRNEYQDALEGQVTETGVGLLYMRDFNKWKNFFRRSGRSEKYEENPR